MKYFDLTVVYGLLVRSSALGPCQYRLMLFCGTWPNVLASNVSCKINWHLDHTGQYAFPKELEQGLSHEASLVCMPGISFFLSSTTLMPLSFL